MTEFNFNETYQAAEKQYNLGKGEYFKPVEGANRIRLVSICLPHESTYMGKTQFKWLCQVLDRKDGKVKPYFMPNTIYKFIADLQMDEDYRFSSIPMPYDITINATGAGTKEVKYSIMPARENKPLTTEEQNLLTEAPTVRELQKKIRENEAQQDQNQPVTSQNEAVETVVEEISIEDIPFN